MSEFKVLRKLFWTFFKVGCFTFGGGLAMLPLIQKEVVDKQGWVNDEEILDIFAVSQSVPGVIAINSSVFIGKKVAGISGAVAAALGVVLPAFISIILILMMLMGIKDNKYVGKVFSGIRAASAGLILISAIKLGKEAIRGKSGLFIALISCLMLVIFNISAVWAVIFGAISGYALYVYNGGIK